MGGQHEDGAADNAHPDVKWGAEEEFREGDAGWRGDIEPVEFAGGGGLGEYGANPAVHERGDVAEGKNSPEQEQAELDRVCPDDSLDAPDAGVEEGEDHE